MKANANPATAPLMPIPIAIASIVRKRCVQNCAAIAGMTRPRRHEGYHRAIAFDHIQNRERQENSLRKTAFAAD